MFEEYDGIPNRLRQVTAETMSPEALYTLDTYPDVSPQDVMYIDESRAEGSSVWQRNDQGDLYRGIIADCRFYSGRFDVEYGDGINDEFYNNDDEQVISAVIDYGYNGEVKIWGDPTFFDAARYMAGLVDNESIENDRVSASDCEIRGNVNDGESRERMNADSFYKRALNGLAKIVKTKRK